MSPATAPPRADRQAALLDWYASTPRSYPWRETTDPYRILVSEVMCQQTQAPRVVSRYETFLDRFPDEQTLASASTGEVLAAWSGLGYNRRAMNLQRAARQVVSAGWPTTVEGLGNLPGVGPYTAAAVACFAFGAQVAAVDTNLRRVLSRWRGRSLEGAALASAAAEEVPTGQAAAWNQAVMDLGATACRPREPQCDRCPVAAWCEDPSVYRPPKPQGRFEGSHRQARGAVLRVLVKAGPQPVADLEVLSGIEGGRVTRAIASLRRDGLVVETEGHVKLPE